MVDIVERLRILSKFRTAAPATTQEAAEDNPHQNCHKLEVTTSEDLQLNRRRYFDQRCEECRADISEIGSLRTEIERLRNRIARLEQALDALGYLKAINTINTITVELGPKASGPDDIADALRKAVGR